SGSVVRPGAARAPFRRPRPRPSRGPALARRRDARTPAESPRMGAGGTRGGLARGERRAARVRGVAAPGIASRVKPFVDLDVIVVGVVVRVVVDVVGDAVVIESR